MKQCKRCVMNDISDQTITFDEKGYCNYCTKAFSEISKVYFPSETGEEKLHKLISEIKMSSKNKKYDCIMGLSGGLDSSYLAYLGYKWGLRVLAVHIDDGFDTEISKQNLKKIIDKTGFDYEVICPDESQYTDLTYSFMKAGVPNIAIPQDNILFAFLYKRMKKNNIKYFLTGGNFSLESILQQGNTYKAFDVVNIKDIHKRFGQKSIRKLELLSTIKFEWYKRVLKIKTPRALNYLNYNRDKAFHELKEFCGYDYYGAKHLENKLTAFIQLVLFPQKFGVDKRTSHLSSMIVSGQMSREDAIDQLAKPMYDQKLMCEYKKEIQTKFGIDDDEYEKLMQSPTHQHDFYKTEDETLLYKVLRILHKMK